MIRDVSRGMAVRALALAGAAILVIGMLAAAACDGGGEGGDGGGSTIGLAGGKVSHESGAEIDIPEGAMADGEISVEIEESDEVPSLPEGLSVVGAVYEIGPAGTTFAMPVRVTLPIPEGEDPEDVVALVTVDPDTGEWAMLSSAVDADAGTASAFTSHLSPFGIVGGKSEAAKTGGWIRVTNTYRRGSQSFPGGRTLPMHLENLVCITAYGPTNPALLVRPSWNVIVATAYWGWTVGNPPTVVEYWLPAGTYTVEDSKFASEINNDPLYLPARKWWTRPPETVVLAPGMTVDFGESTDIPPSASSGFEETPNSCAPGATTTVTPRATPCSWTGTWDTNWGSLTATQTGGTVTGDYEYDEGKITGTVSGNTLTGTWSEAPSYAPPYDAGGFVFTMSPDCQSISGTWGYGSDSGSSSWEGTRASGAPTTTRMLDCPTTPTGYPDIAGEWIEVSGFPSSGHSVTVTQSGATIAAVGGYAIGGTNIAYTVDGTITRDGVITARLVHTEGVSPDAEGFAQDRRMELTPDCSTLDIFAETVGGGGEHQLSWQRASP